MFASDRKWESMTEREIGKGETRPVSCSVTVHIKTLCCGPIDMMVYPTLPSS